MKNYILEKLTNYQELTSDEIMNLCDDKFLNSSFKLNLIKDKSKNAKVSDTKFYLKSSNNVLKFQYDEISGRLTICTSNDITKDFESFVKKLTLDNCKIEFSCNSDFDVLLNILKNNNYVIEVVRKDRFYNGNYQDEVIISKLKGGN
mgnify:CR=1 FL=1